MARTFLAHMNYYETFDQSVGSQVLHKLVRILEKHDNKFLHLRIKLFIDGEFDGNNATKFEGLSNKNQIGVLARTPIVGFTLLFLLRILVDERIDDWYMFLGGVERGGKVLVKGLEHFDPKKRAKIYAKSETSNTIKYKLKKSKVDFENIFHTTDVDKIVGYFGEREIAYSQFFDLYGKRLGGNGMSWDGLDSHINIMNCDIWTFPRIKEGFKEWF